MPEISRRGFPIHATAEVHIPGSTTTYTKVNVAATFGQKAAPSLGLLHERITCGSVQAEPWKARQMLLSSWRRQEASSTRPQRQQGFHRQIFAQRSRSGVEAVSRHEQQISTG